VAGLWQLHDSGLCGSYSQSRHGLGVSPKVLLVMPYVLFRHSFARQVLVRVSK
jgi:hypothetical protein